MFFMVEFMFINKNALRRCCVGIALSSLCSVSGMSSLMPEMINEVMLKATVDKYKEEIREIGNIDNAPLLYIRMVLQTFVDYGKTEIEGLKEGVISDDFLNLSLDVGDENLWLYNGPYEVVKGYINSLGLLAKSESNPLRDDERDQRTRSSLINLSLLTSEMVEKRIAELLEKKVVSNDDVNTIETPSADLVDVDDEIKRILPRGECFRDFIALLSELHERSGYSIALPSVSDFVSLGRRFIALVEEKPKLEKKCSLTAEEVEKIEDEKISLGNELKQIKEQLDSARKYATDGVYLSHDGVKVVKTIESANLNSITSSIAIEKVGVYNNEEFGLVSKENEEKAKLLDKGTHNVYDIKNQGVYNTRTHSVVTHEEFFRMLLVSRRNDLLAYDLSVQIEAKESQLAIMCRKRQVVKITKDDMKKNAEAKFGSVEDLKKNTKVKLDSVKDMVKNAKAELDSVFGYINTIASWFSKFEYGGLSVQDIIYNKLVKELLLIENWVNNGSLLSYISNKTPGGECTYKFMIELNRVIGASIAAAGVNVDSLLVCNIGDAINEHDLRVKLLLAAIDGYDVEDIKKTF